MSREPLVSHLRTHRNRSGFTQGELAQLVGYSNETAVSRQERGERLPSLRVALAYAAIFQVTVADLFPALHEATVQHIGAQMADLKQRLGKKSARDRDANATARKLQFMTAREIGIEL